MNQETGLTAGQDAFEGLRQTNDHGAEYWSARDLQSLLGYSQWRRFEQAIDRAKTSCEQSGNDPDHHFAGAGKMVELGSKSVREVPDYQLSRLATVRDLWAINNNRHVRRWAFAEIAAPWDAERTLRIAARASVW